VGCAGPAEARGSSRTGQNLRACDTRSAVKLDPLFRRLQPLRGPLSLQAAQNAGL
jgi:hypothetical protein